MLALGRGFGIAAGVVVLGRGTLAFGTGDGFVPGVTGRGELVPRPKLFGGGALVLLSGLTLAGELVLFDQAWPVL